MLKLLGWFLDVMGFFFDVKEFLHRLWTMRFHLLGIAVVVGAGAAVAVHLGEDPGGVAIVSAVASVGLFCVAALFESVRRWRRQVRDLKSSRFQD
jgi:hypothetical protein